MFKIKAVQMDLARQKETIKEIYRYLDLASDSGFNTVVLYLEDRIKIGAYKYSADEDSYSENEVKEILSYAAIKNLEIIPVVSNLGHMERFFRHPELQHLSELREGGRGRFDEKIRCACPSLKESYDYFDAYIKDVARLFPSEYFHVGLDEVWDMGYCSLCRDRREKEGLSGIFVQHIIHTHELLASLGKTMLIWDDMFEIFNESLQSIPKDIILCAWNYRYINPYPAGCFDNSLKTDKFTLYDNLGFDYIMSTYLIPYNVQSYTKYALQHKPLGALATIWNKTNEQLLPYYPLIANAGMLFNGLYLNDPTERMKLAVEKVLESKESFTTIVSAILSKTYFYDPVNMIYITEFDKDEETDYAINNCLLEQFDRNISEELKEVDFIPAIRDFLTKPILAYNVKKVANALFDHRTGFRLGDTEYFEEKLSQYLTEAKRQEEEQLRLWERCRNNLPAQSMTEYYHSLIEQISQMKDNALKCKFGEIGRLNIGFFMPDKRVAPTVKITLYYKDESICKINPRQYKYFGSENSYYTISFPIDAELPVSKCLIEVWGYGSIGVTYVDASNRQEKFVPYDISRVSGCVTGEHNILFNDTRWCYLGIDDVLYPFNQLSADKITSSVEIHLKEELYEI